MIARPIRIQLRRTKGWKMPPNTVNVARPTKWGNPTTVQSAGSAESAVSRYWKHIEFLIANRRRDLTELSGRNLACWCPLDQPCHADVLLELANAEVKP